MSSIQHYPKLIATTDTLLLQSNARRLGLIFSPPSGGAYEVNFLGAAALGGGIRIPAGSQALVLTARDFGANVKNEVRAVADGVAVTVGITEILDT